MLPDDFDNINPSQKVLQHTHTLARGITVNVLYLSRDGNGFGLPLDTFKHKGLAVGQYQRRRKTTFINNLWPIHRLSVSAEGYTESSFTYTQCTLEAQRMEE